ncbi:M56 family metallopeptidase [Cohnella nanjingensis]|uniref:M56 family metallopeptidase n=1 Tax=Cohnella nanjingensis TaxID=1387779 RepID=A0A7X0RSY0_9BACL|nr:M56 family metallopeptidase [Cohnella nanjingensis]MBB6671896.1 M56 family metallopeptidase [Cohnella nanjingensis]
MRLLEAAFAFVLAASLASAVILLPLLLIRRLFGKRLGPRVVHGLWFLLLIKLLVPIGPYSSLSLYHLLPQVVHEVWQSQTQPAPQDGSTGSHSSDAGASTGHRAGTETASGSAPQATAAPASSPAESARTSSPTAAAGSDRDWLHNGLRIGAVVWLGGLAALLAYYLLATRRFARSVSGARRIDDEAVLSVLEACKERLGIKRRIAAYETGSLSSPCLYGLAKPGIYVPEDLVAIADERQLAHILLHELTHYKRRDLWLNLLWTLTVFVHWFNPVAWLAMRKMKADREVACDAGVLEVLGERESSSYGMTLLMLSRLLARSAVPRVNLSHFLEDRHEMKRRITMIAKFKKGSYRLSAAAIVLVLAVGVVLITIASAPAKSVVPSGAPAANAGKENASSRLPIERLNDWAKWFHSLPRAAAFTDVAFQVPDHLPVGYELESIDILEKYVQRAEDLVTLRFKSGYGTDNVRTFEVNASKGNLLKKYSRQEGGDARSIAPAMWGPAQPRTFRYEEATYANMPGTLVTEIQSYDWHLPEVAKSFVWQVGDVWYSIDFYSENHTLKEGLPQHWRNLTQKELEPILTSFVPVQQARNATYEGLGNSFPLYDEQDLTAAEKILGFDVKLPAALSNGEVKLSDVMLLQTGDRNTGFSFRPDADALWSTYRASSDSKVYKLNDEISLYQSNVPLVDAAKLSDVRTLDMNGVAVTVGKDDDNAINLRGVRPNDPDIRSQTYYLWQQDGVCYLAYFWGLDPNQEEMVKELITAARR